MSDPTAGEQCPTCGCAIGATHDVAAHREHQRQWEAIPATPATPDTGDASGPVKVGKIGLNWIAECDEHAEIIWCSDWAMALEAAYGHVAMHHPRICDHEIGFIISDRHRCLGCGVDLAMPRLR